MARYHGFDATSFKRDLARFGREAARAVPGAVDRASHELAEEIRRRCPVNTGHLRDTVKVGPLEVKDGVVTQVVEVGEDRPADGRWYVGFVEYGARNTPPHPFIRPAIEAKQAEMIRTIESAMPGD